MRAPVLIAVGLLLTGGAAAGQDPPAAALPTVQGFEIVATYPHDPGAFTQGLIVHDGDLIETTGRYPSTLRRVRLADGTVLQKRELDRAYFGEGVTELGGKLFSLTWQNGTGFIWNADDLSPLGQFAYPGEGWGLTDDGQRLILSDGTPVIRFLDPVTFAETGRITVTYGGRPVTRLNELEWIDGQIVANLWRQDLLVRIDPVSGAVVGVIDLTDILPVAERVEPTDDVLNGIAWDAAGRRLFVTGKNWPKLFEIRLTDAE
ncbi:glutaminyl-peptide cyclotransferase [Brevundimonas variabilis]|uniref:Glutamine cyclotransferase n=1 Tax=Brevundimonas variabilis TaxID=74312 RepID=A0A7W9CFW5_9CAUL|nr:glutaminyl-peptide cyclotransferase [Brevundimonas variabilis]MBB5744691.1 glutamine cyclotransferase [Brevundimonas variabilis]